MPEPKLPHNRTAQSSGIEVIGVALTVIWVLGVGAFFLFIPTDASNAAPFGVLRILMALLAVFLPIAMIWVAIGAARSARDMRVQAQNLQSSIDALRADYARAQVAQTATAQPTVERKLEEIASSARKTESTLATFASKRETLRPKPAQSVKPTPMAEDQGSLELGTTSEDIAPPLERKDLIRAINFPDTEQDQEGFAALRRALQARPTRELIQASQDVLTLLSQDGIYMDDLRPDRARPEIWRRFAQGERGRSMAALGGVRDRSSLALTAARMREDTIFRDTAHHFLRKFDQMLVRFEGEASDEDLIALSETRSARAFMILGRVTGAFD